MQFLEYGSSIPAEDERMTDIGEILGKANNLSMIIGIIIGITGGIIASFAYPVYNTIVKAKRKKLAPEIIRLTDELMK